MGWGIANNDEELQFIYHNNRLDLEDGRIAYWAIEDWEIYGEGGGGYTSSGPFVSWAEEIQSWFQSGLMIGRDILRWNSGNRDPGPNLDNFLALPSALCQNICNFMDGPKIAMINGVVSFGAARQYNGVSNPQIGQGDVMPGDIVVIGSRYHDDQSMTFRYRAFDHDGGGFADFAENYDFLSVAIAESDALAGVTPDYSNLVGPPSAELIAAFQAMKVQIESILSTLRFLPADSYFAVSYTDDGGHVRQGRIRISELIMWFSRIDFEFYPENHPFGNSGDGGVYVRNRSSMRNADVTLRVDEASFRTWASGSGTTVWYLIHEIVHATNFGNSLYARYGNGIRLEKLVNGFALALANTIAPAQATAVASYVNTTVPATPTTPAYDYTPAPDGNTTFVTPTT